MKKSRWRARPKIGRTKEKVKQTNTKNKARCDYERRSRIRGNRNSFKTRPMSAEEEREEGGGSDRKKG